MSLLRHIFTIITAIALSSTIAFSDAQGYLYPPTLVSGIVLMPSGSPAANADVDCQSVGLENTTCKNDSNGKFTLSSKLRPTYVTAQKGDLETLMPEAILNAQVPVTLKLAPAQRCTVYGTLKDQDGKPMAAALISLSHQFAYGESSVPNVLAKKRSDANGYFEFANLPYGFFDDVLVSHPGYADAWARISPSVGYHANDQFPDIVLRKLDSFVEGTVVNEFNQPVQGVKVTISYVESEKALTDKNGRFRIEHAPSGEITLNATAMAQEIHSLQDFAKANVNVRTGDTKARAGQKNIRILISRHQMFGIIGETSEEFLKPHIGDKAPEFSVLDINSKPVSLSDYKNQLILIHTLFIDLNHSNNDSPKELEALRQKGVQVITICLSKDKNQVISWINENIIDFPIIYDGLQWKTPIAQLYNITGAPYNILIGKDGRILAKGLYGKDLIDEVNDAIVAKKTITTQDRDLKQ